jgi:hypothetical protein
MTTEENGWNTREPLTDKELEFWQAHADQPSHKLTGYPLPAETFKALIAEVTASRGSGMFPKSVSDLEGVQYIRITGAAEFCKPEPHRATAATNLNQLTLDEVVHALAMLCDYCTDLEHQVDRLSASATLRGNL